MDASEAAPYTVADSFLAKTPCFHSLSPNSVRESNRKETPQSLGETALPTALWLGSRMTPSTEKENSK